MPWPVYSTPYASVAEFRPKPSRSLAAWTVAAHALAALSLAGSGFPAAAGLLVIAVVPFALRRALRPLGPDVRCIIWSPARGWARRSVSHQYIPMELAPSSVVTRVAIFLHWRDDRGVWRVLIPRDSLDEDDYRRLRVLARFHDAGRTHC